MKSTILCVLLIYYYPKVDSIHFTDVTNEVFGASHQCLLAAFGDFNSDKLTDVFCLKNNSRMVDVLIGHEEIPLLKPTQISCSLKEGETISSVMPGDFNGDSMMDLLITNDKNDVYVFWGNLDSLNCTKEPLHLEMGSQPLLLDYNGDMIPDLFAEHKNGTKYFWVARDSNFIPTALGPDKSEHRLAMPHSCSFLDLDSDLESDLLVTNINNIEYYLKEDEEGFHMSSTFDYPAGYKIWGQSLFVDLDGDGIIEHIMPACVTKCEQCAILVRSLNSSHWDVLLSHSKLGDKAICFENEKINSITLPSTLRSADIDMDGTPDFLMIIKNHGKNEMILLQNEPCGHCPFGRTLNVIWNVLGSMENVVLAAFYDLYEDGVMDILVTVQDGKEYKLLALQNKFTTDAYFIKVLVVGGLCYGNCPDDHHPYGTNQPGPLVKYKTTGQNGQAKVGAAVQLPQSAHFSLLLPYSVFGLSQTPNFVDEVEIIIPGGKGFSIRKRLLTQIIPNSQIVVIPYPPDTPKYWVAKLFVTPSHLVLMTFAALIGTCLFICIIIGALHWKERRQDKRERLLEAHRFHFDAM